MLVNVASQRDQSRFIKNYRRDRPFFRTITAKVKSFGGGIRKNIVISVIQVWKFDSGSHLDRQQRWNERQILLRKLLCWQRSRSRKIAVEIDHRQWRLRRKNSGLGDDLVALGLNRRRARLRKLHASLNSRTRQERSGNDEKNRAERQQSQLAHYLASLARLWLNGKHDKITRPDGSPNGHKCSSGGLKSGKGNKFVTFSLVREHTAIRFCAIRGSVPVTAAPGIIA